MDRRIVRQPAGGADPHVEAAAFDLLAADSVRIRPGAARSAARARNSGAPDRAWSAAWPCASPTSFGSSSGGGTSGIVGLMLEAGLVGVKRDQHRKDRVAVLARGDAPRGEALAVADAVDVVDDRDLGIAGQQEIGVHRMRRAAPSTVRTAATSAWPITWPPNTRCQPACGERPRNRFRSSGSRSRMSSRSWTAEDMAGGFHDAAAANDARASREVKA